MEENLSTLFLMQNSDKFPSHTLPLIKQKLNEADESHALLIQTQEYRSPVFVLIISLLVGTLGIDRFLLGQTGLGATKLLTCGGLGFWTIVDWFIIMSATKESNFEKFLQVA